MTKHYVKVPIYLSHSKCASKEKARTNYPTNQWKITRKEEYDDDDDGDDDVEVEKIE